MFMKRISLLFIAVLSFYFSPAITPQQLDTATYKLCKQIMYLNPYKFKMEEYAELAYLKRTYQLYYLNINDTTYRDKKAFNNYYYDQFILFKKFFDENAIIPEDCLNIPGSTSEIHPMNKLIFYAIYPETVKIPADYIEQLEKNATAHEFLGPYRMLTAIYFLKKYNYQNLTELQKSKLAVVENHLTNLLYKKYIENKPWSSLKLMSVKLLKMNESSLVKNIDISELVEDVLNNQPIHYYDEDIKNYTQILGEIGGNRVLADNGLALLWIFLLENKKN